MEPVEEELRGLPPTPQEDALMKWAEDAVAKGIVTANEALGRLVTLFTVLLAGSTALLTQLPLPPLGKGLALALLLIGLAIALWGSFPREVLMDTLCPADIEEKRETVANFKMNCLRGASLALVLAFAVVLFGLLF